MPLLNKGLPTNNDLDFDSDLILKVSEPTTGLLSNIWVGWYNTWDNLKMLRQRQDSYWANFCLNGHIYQLVNSQGIPEINYLQLQIRKEFSFLNPYLFADLSFEFWQEINYLDFLKKLNFWIRVEMK